MYDVAMLVFAAIAAIFAVLAVLPSLGFDLRIRGRQNMPPAQTESRPMRKAWLALGLALLSLGLSAAAFYYFFRPRIVEKVVATRTPSGTTDNVGISDSAAVEVKPAKIPSTSLSRPAERKGNE
ncbi:MAG: hypothetical protein WCA49_21755 [Candidatus Sulfotelmatobacter sp.]